MIYFKITDKESEAWYNHEAYLGERVAALDKIEALIGQLGLDTNRGTVHMSVLTSFEWKKGHHIPTGMRVKDKRKLVTDNRTTAGKEIQKKMKAIHFPTAMDYMEMMFGASGESMSAGGLYQGCGLTAGEDIVLINCRPDVYEDARQKESFSVPQGLEEIKGSVYTKLRKKALAKNNQS